MKSLIALILLSASIFSHTDAGTWSLDQAHSGISFSVQHMVISEVTGVFRTFSVDLSSVKDDFTDAAIAASLEVKSIDTGNDRRDSHLRTDDFFNAEKFPSIRFRSTSVEKVSEKAYRIKGFLTIRDTTREVTLDARLNGTLVTKQGTRAGWKANLDINRFDYGLKWNKTLDTGGLIAGDIVHLTFNLEFVKP